MRIGRYVLLLLISRFLVVTFGCLLLVIPPMLVAAVSKLGGVELSTILTYLPLQSIELLPYLLPFILLVAVTETYATLVDQREWLATQALGIHPWGVILPCLVLGGVLSLSLGWMLTNVFPALRYRQSLLMRDAQLEVLAGLFPGQTQVQVGDFSMVGRARDGDSLFDVVIRMPSTTEKAERLVVHAKRADLRFDQEALRLGLNDVWMKSGETDVRLAHLDFVADSEDILPHKVVDRQRIKYMNSSVIEELRSEKGASRHSPTQLEYEYHRRLALAATAALFALVGVATGLHTRGNASLFAVGASMLVGGAHFFVTLQVGESLGMSDWVDPWAGAWTSNLLLGVLGGVVLIRAVRRA